MHHACIRLSVGIVLLLHAQTVLLLSALGSSIIRFLGEDGKEHIGQPSDDLKSAEILEGSIFEHKLSGKKVEVTKLLAPLQPAVILCIGTPLPRVHPDCASPLRIGLNYKPHAKESQMAIPKLPVLFMKNPSAATGPTDSIVIPAVAKDVPQIDYEGELAVVIGKRCATGAVLCSQLTVVAGARTCRRRTRCRMCLGTRWQMTCLRATGSWTKSTGASCAS